jgi:2-C-methyl-D-erythritol 4-phosphate cytidylyltransferase
VTRPVWAIVVAAGAGRRYGGLKQFDLLGGTRVVDRSLRVASAACDAVVVVVPPDRAGDAFDADRVAIGGPTRSDSVRAGLAAVDPSAEVIVVHDAARPLADVGLYGRVIGAVRAGADGAVPGLPLSDTVKRVDPSGRVLATLDRDALVAVQTPQAFAAEVLRSAHRRGGQATDDAGLVEAGGGTVVVVAGDPAAAKITGPDDLLALERSLAARR